MSKKFQDLETKVIHAGEPEPRIEGAVTMPIFQTAMFEYAGETESHNLRYVRLNNTPNHTALHRKLADIENAEDALVAASGMSAITSTLLTVLAPGGHLLVQDKLYGGTLEFVTGHLEKLGLSYDFIDGTNPETWKTKLKPNTKAIYTETMTNPTLEVADHWAVTSFAEEHGLISIIDNTFASPVNFRPTEVGYHLSLHSGTKYLNGHSDIAAGAVIGKADLVHRIKLQLNMLGGSLDPHACFLLYRGLKTLALRVQHQNETAMRLALFLEQHPLAVKVNYPGLTSHPHYRRAQELFAGFCGVLSFELEAGPVRLEKFVSQLQLPVHAFSLGGVETLIIQPSKSSHINLSAEERLAAGIPDSLLRVSVGLESSADLIEDFRQALNTI